MGACFVGRLPPDAFVCLVSRDTGVEVVWLRGAGSGGRLLHPRINT